jgi:pimeloyl-ACP methyl ester carboxylesterase
MPRSKISSFPRATGFGSVDDVPQLPRGFTDTFESHLVEANGIRHHVVAGGDGPPLLLLGGWPQNWFAWRHLMLPLAQRYTVLAVDARGVGLSDKPRSGYDSTTLAKDMAELMTVLGHDRFAVVGYDVGLWTAYAMAVDFPGPIQRMALGEAIIPGVSPSPPLIADERGWSDALWHFNFNRALEVNEQLVVGREELYFGYQFATKAGSAEALPAYAREFYIEVLKRDRNALRGSFEVYRAIDASIPQNRARARTKLEVPILAFAGALFGRDIVVNELRTLATRVESVIIPDCGHYPAEEKPAELLRAFEAFFDPYAQSFGQSNA